MKAVIFICMRLTLQQETELCGLYGKISKNEIMQRFGLTNAPIIYRILRRHGVPIKSKSDANIWKRRLNIFTEITEEWQAYFLGLLFSDGNLYKNRVSISLVEDDFYIVEEICRYLFIDTPKYYKSVHRTGSRTGKPQLCVGVSNIEFSKILQENFNLHPKKSLTCPFPTNIPTRFMTHFIRGYFDGDGCILAKKWGQRFDVIGSHEFCLELKMWMKTNLQIDAKIEVRGKVSRLQVFNKKDIATLYHFLYDKASIYLNRKYIKFKDIVGNFDWLKINHKKYSSHKYVSYDKRRQKWIVNKKSNGKNKFYGYFLSENEAIEMSEKLIS